MEILYTEFGSIWITSWPDKKDLILKLLIWNNRKFPYEKLTFFLGKLYQNLFVLESSYPWDTRYQVWFTLNNSLTRSKRPIFKICYLRNSQISVCKSNFFPRQTIPKILFVLQSSYPCDTLCRVWFNLNNFLTR